ncbi:hypothetical protein L195_g063969, partial [Trifolium pratense]
MAKLLEGPPLHFKGALAKPYKGKQLVQLAIAS